MPVFLLSDTIAFPPPHLAEKEGLLAIGGDLRKERLLLAYQMGVFPWFSKDDPIMWWSPDPRLVLYPSDLKISKSLRKCLHKEIFKITLDREFKKVITLCARTRTRKNEATWIVDEMIDAYCRLHDSGFAHSVEAWHQGELVGGLYGVSLGKAFFGESMFTTVSNASKVAFVFLVAYLRTHNFHFIDCQTTTSHLVRFGAREISRKRFLTELKRALNFSSQAGKWALNTNDHQASPFS